MEDEFTRNNSLRHESWRIQRELGFAFHMAKTQEFEWLQDDVMAEELEDALYDGKWRPKRKVARGVLMDNLQEQIQRTGQMFGLCKGLEEIIEYKESRASRMEQDLSDRDETIRDLKQQLEDGEIQRKKFEENADGTIKQLTEQLADSEAKRKDFREKSEERMDEIESTVNTITAYEEKANVLLRCQEIDRNTIKCQEKQMESAAKALREYSELLQYHQSSSREKKLELEKAEKSLEKAGKALKARDRSITELKESIAAHERKYNELEKDIKTRERDVRVREDAAKVREHELNSQSRGAKEATKETGKELKTVRSQLKVSEAKVVELEKKIQSAADEYQILKLDFDTTVSELETLRAAKAEDRKPEAKMQEQFRKLKEDRDKFRGLYETARTNEPIIQDRIAKAVRLAKAEAATSLNTQFEVWKERTKEVIHSTDEKFREAEARAKELEGKIGETSVEAEARISEILKDTDERIQDLSRAKLGLVAEIGAKDAEISWLKQRLAALNYAV